MTQAEKIPGPASPTGTLTLATLSLVPSGFLTLPHVALWFLSTLSNQLSTASSA